MTPVEFHDAERRLSATLLSVSVGLPENDVSLRDLLALIGEQGLLLVWVFLALPFLLPVSIPGVSTVFGVEIILVGVGVFGAVVAGRGILTLMERLQPSPCFQPLTGAGSCLCLSGARRTAVRFPGRP